MMRNPKRKRRRKKESPKISRKINRIIQVSNPQKRSPSKRKCRLRSNLIFSDKLRKYEIFYKPLLLSKNKF